VLRKICVLETEREGCSVIRKICVLVTVREGCTVIRKIYFCNDDF